MATATKPQTVNNPEDQWQARIAAKIEAGVPHSEAVRAVARECPHLHTAYIVAHNLERGRRVAARDFRESR